MMKQNEDFQDAVRGLIESSFPCLRRTVRKNLTRLTCAFLRLALSVRFGYGGLHLTSVVRCLEKKDSKFKSAYKWLGRFLRCKYFDPSSLAECMLALVLGHQPPPWVIVLVDQTTIHGVQVVSAAIPFQGRAVPVAWVDFEYPWKTLTPPSQNTIERYLLTWLGEAVPTGVRLILVFDRGYARVELIKDLNQSRQPLLIRARSQVIVQAPVRGRRQRLSLGRLPHRMGWATRYHHVLYQSQKAEPVDVIVYRQRGFEQPWFLLVPPDSETWLPTEEVVRLYRQRMQIEHCFRDWKSHLGLRGLPLQVTITNPGPAPADFFLDARLNTTASLTLATEFGTPNSVPLPLPLGSSYPIYLVPTETSSVSVSQTSSVPAMFDWGPYSGVPDISPSAKFSSLCSTTASASFTPPGGTVTQGLWNPLRSECGPLCQPGTHWNRFSGYDCPEQGIRPSSNLGERRLMAGVRASGYGVLDLRAGDHQCGADGRHLCDHHAVRSLGHGGPRHSLRGRLFGRRSPVRSTERR